MFTRDFRIWGSILISWTVFLFIFPVLAMLTLGFFLCGAVFYKAHAAIRDGVSGIRVGSQSATFYREGQPIGFWSCVAFNVVTGSLMFVLFIYVLVHEISVRGVVDLFWHTS
jgi:hypothetical protein